MITRDVAGAESRDHDLIVIGGGIYGVCVALQSASRGLRPLLVERGDFGHATSWNTLRIVHGGLRYLQTLDFPRFRESVRERGWLRSRFPELVVPLRCLMPLYGRGLRRPAVFRVALAVERRLAARALAPDLSDGALPPGRVIGPDETASIFPAVPRDGLGGGAVWYDAFMPSSERLLIELLRWAVALGASALNRVEATEPIVRDGRIEGLRARDNVRRADVAFRSRTIVNCAGPQAAEVAGRFDRAIPRLFRPSIGFNLLLARQPAADAAVAVDSSMPGGGTYFLQPWGHRMMVGTYHAPVDESRPPSGVSEELVREFVDDLNATLPELRLSTDEVLRVHWGFLPVARPGTTTLTSREEIYDHGAHGGPPGLHSVSGIKFTTARCVAEKAVARIFGTRQPPLGGAGDERRPEPSAWPGALEIERLFAEAPADAEAVVRAIVREESVLEPDDLLLRRTDWGFDPEVLARLAPRVRAVIAGEAR